MKEPIEWTRVESYVYATETYLNDIPMKELVSAYVKLYKVDKHMYAGEFDINGVSHRVSVNDKINKCFINNVPYDAEQFVLLFEKEGTESEIIKRITGIDLDDYICEIYYNDGEIEQRRVKGKFEINGIVTTKDYKKD